MTAVEQYKKQMIDLAVDMQHQKINLHQFLIKLGDFGEKAKEMEKQQKINFAEAFYNSLFQDAESYHNYLESKK